MFQDEFAQRGCLVVDELFDTGLIDRVRDEYRRQYDVLDPDNLPPHLAVGDKRFHLPVRLRGPLLDPNLYGNPILMGMLAMLFRTHFLIDSVTFVTALPGAEEQHHHRDHSLLFAQASTAATLSLYAVTVGIPLIDLDPLTGTTRMFPGSNGAVKGASGAPAAFDEEVCPYIKRGGCFLMDYRLWHAGLPNRSTQERPILYIVYACEWFTDVVNFLNHARMTIEPADVVKIPAKDRHLFRRLAGEGLLDTSIGELLTCS